MERGRAGGGRPGYDRSGVGPDRPSESAGSAGPWRCTSTLLTAGEAQDWGICGVGVLASDDRMRTRRPAPGRAVHTVSPEADGSLAPRGRVPRGLPVRARRPGAVIERITHPDTDRRSTITEGGYAIDQKTGEFDPEFPGSGPGRHGPAGAFGLGVGGLARRRGQGTGPLTIMSCDNMQGSGDVARRVARGRPAARRKPAPGSPRTSPFELHGGPDHPATADADREAGRAVQPARRLAGRLRAVLPVGARGRLRRRPPGVQRVRGPARRRRRALSS
ncbi:hypothetical protein HBB16_11690 [Pseudonocardia sp. MCCB 268]|nr:hypothetical protein [Pseudonocardia cytotoxica]